VSGRQRSCCQNRNVFQPRHRSCFVTRRSRSLLPTSLFCQNARFVFGMDPWSGQPCQKHPSTNIASLEAGKTKSGLPNIPDLRRQPTMPWSRNILIRQSSVARLPRLFTRDIIRERFRGEKTSAIGYRHRPEIILSAFQRFYNFQRVVFDEFWRQSVTYH
jgi:hypothetical protein